MMKYKHRRMDSEDIHDLIKKIDPTTKNTQISVVEKIVRKRFEEQSLDKILSCFNQPSEVKRSKFKILSSVAQTFRRKRS